MANPKANEVTSEIQIIRFNQGELRVCILGTSPLIMEAVSDKARRELLCPRGRLNSAERAGRLKHNPLDEYRASVYVTSDPAAKTRLAFPSAAFKKAAASAALDIPGAAKTQIGRLLWAVGDRVELFGVPKMVSTIVRSSDMAHTPDVRTRAILPEWACNLTFRFMMPLLRETAVANLLGAAGVIRGVGGWRQEKGSGSYGQFALASADDADFVRICQSGTRAAQDAALANPEYYDDETEKLFTWFASEVERRGSASGNGQPANKKRTSVTPEVSA